jgi:hypothetical protein
VRSTGGGAAVGRTSANATWMMPAAKPTATPIRQASCVGARRVIDQTAAIGADKAAELVAHEGQSLDHRLPLQPEHLGDRARDQGTDAEPEESHEGAEYQCRHRRRRHHEVKAEHQRAADIDAAKQRELVPAPAGPAAVEQILGTFDFLERRFAGRNFRGCPFVNAVAELGEDKSVKKMAVAFKESRRLWFRERLVELGVTNPDGLATQLQLLVDGSIAQDLVRDDPAMARAAKEAAKVLLRSAGVEVG